MLKHLLDGGLIMIPLALLSVTVVAVILDRMALFRKIETDAGPLRKAVLRDVQSDNVEGAIATCENTGGAVAALLAAGLVKFQALRERGGMSLGEIKTDVDKTMTDYAPHVMDLLEDRLNLLILVAGVSPLLGMTGTVVGMIQSFASLSADGMAADTVGAGISQALVTTAAGLIVAIPAVVAHSLFTRKIDRFALQLEESAMELMEAIRISCPEKV